MEIKTLENIRQLKDPFIWFAADGSVMVADGGFPVEGFDSSMNWITIWLDKVQDMGYFIDGWRVFSGGSTFVVSIDNEKILLRKV
jgi:hypothetical protein